MVYLMRNIPDGPPPDRQFDIVHPNISLYDMDLIKLTAQYAAINGKKVKIVLPYSFWLVWNKESRKIQFSIS